MKLKCLRLETKLIEDDARIAESWSKRPGRRVLFAHWRAVGWRAVLVLMEA